MLAIGRYILRGQFQAIGAISLASVLSPLLWYPGSVMLALVVLRRGGLVGLRVIGGSFLLVLLVVYLVQITPWYGVFMALAIWLPVWCAATALRASSSQGLMVLAAGLICLASVLALDLYLGDITTWLRAWAENLAEVNLPPESRAEFSDMFGVMTGLPLIRSRLASLQTGVLVTAILLARWWQSRLFFPGEFRREFLVLRLPRMLIYPTALGILLFLVTFEQQQMLVHDLILMLVFLYLFQGIAAVHRIVDQRNLSHRWLVGMYVMILFLYPVVSCIGMVDSWVTRGGKRAG